MGLVTVGAVETLTLAFPSDSFLPIGLPYPASYEGFLLIILNLILSCLAIVSFGSLLLFERKQKGTNLEERRYRKELGGDDQGITVVVMDCMKEQSILN